MLSSGEQIVYVSCAVSKHVAILGRSPSGVMRELDRVPLEGGNGRLSSLPLALSPDRRTLFAALREAPNPVYSFTIDPASGALSPEGRLELPGSPAFIETDPSGRYLVSASYHSRHVAVCDLQASGPGSVKTCVLDNASKVHSIRFHPTGRQFYVGVVGVDQIMQFRLEAGSPVLISHFQAKPRTGPRHITTNTEGNFLYAVDEKSATVGAYAVDAASGDLTELQSLPLAPADVNALGAAQVHGSADVHLTPDGRFLYGSLRTPARLAGFAVDQATGRLQYIETVETEPVPRGFVITPEGDQLIAPGQKSDKIAVFSIDSATGRLARIDSLTLSVAGAPSWIVMP